MRARLAAAAAGSVLIAAVVVGFALTHNPPVAGGTGVEPGLPSVLVNAGAPLCQPLSRVPPGADRLTLVVAYRIGGAQNLRVRISDHRGLVAKGALAPARFGEQVVSLRPRTRAAHRARLCFSVPGQGRIVLGGDLKRQRGSAKGPDAQKHVIAGAVFLRPGSASWLAQTGTISDRYGNSQTGITGGWSLWLAVLCAVAAVLFGLCAVVWQPERAERAT